MSVNSVNARSKTTTFEAYVSCKDHLVSGEKFDLLLDENLDLLLTNPKPKTEDLGKYYESKDYISHTDSKKNIVDSVYQIVKNFSLKKKLDLVNSFNTERAKILDIGCGTGDFLKVCSDSKWKVIGVEPNRKARALAMSKSNTTSSLFFDSVDELIEDTVNHYSFDVITMWHVLEHIPNLDETIFNLKKLLKPEGVLVVAVPNFKSYDADYYKEFWAAYDVPRHLWHFSQTAIRRLFFFQAMEVVKTLPMKFDSFYVSLLSEKNKTQNNNFFKAFFVGLRSNLKAKYTNEYSSLIYVIENSKNWLEQ